MIIYHTVMNQIKRAATAVLGKVVPEKEDKKDEESSVWSTSSVPNLMDRRDEIKEESSIVSSVYLEPNESDLIPFEDINRFAPKFREMHKHVKKQHVNQEQAYTYIDDEIKRLKLKCNSDAFKRKKRFNHNYQKKYDEQVDWLTKLRDSLSGNETDNGNMRKQYNVLIGALEKRLQTTSEQLDERDGVVDDRILELQRELEEKTTLYDDLKTTKEKIENTVKEMKQTIENGASEKVDNVSAKIFRDNNKSISIMKWTSFAFHSVSILLFFFVLFHIINDNKDDDSHMMTIWIPVIISVCVWILTGFAIHKLQINTFWIFLDAIFTCIGTIILLLFLTKEDVFEHRFVLGTCILLCVIMILFMIWKKGSDRGDHVESEIRRANLREINAKRRHEKSIRTVPMQVW